MTASNSLSVFHQWLLTEPNHSTPACSIALHGRNPETANRLVEDIANYLNEYDDDGEGGWLPATGELVEKISQDANHRRLLGLEEYPSPTDARGEYEKTLSALGQRGHVIFQASDSSTEETSLPNAFHAGIGTGEEMHGKFHVILNPELLDENSIAHIIGDVFLEWLLRETRRNTSIEEIR